MNRSLGLLAAVLGALVATGCGGDGVGSEEDAHRAYVGLDTSIDKAIQLPLLVTVNAGGAA